MMLLLMFDVYVFMNVFQLLAIVILLIACIFFTLLWKQNYLVQYLPLGSIGT